MDLYSQGYERSYTVNSSILNAIEPHLKDFQQLLLDPPKVTASMQCQVMTQSSQFGFNVVHHLVLLKTEVTNSFGAKCFQSNIMSCCFYSILFTWLRLQFLFLGFSSGLFPSQKSAILTTVGILEQPLGNARLHVARLVASLLQTSVPNICQELCNLATMDLLLVSSTWHKCYSSCCFHHDVLYIKTEMCLSVRLSKSCLRLARVGS